MFIHVGEETSKPPTLYKPQRFVQMSPPLRAEVRITLRGRSESPPIIRSNVCSGSSANSSPREASKVVRRNSLTTSGSQYAPIRKAQLETAGHAIGQSARAQFNESVTTTAAECAHDYGNLEKPAAKRLPPLYPGSSWLPLATASAFSASCSSVKTTTTHQQPSAQASRPVSGNFSSTFSTTTFFNGCNHACLTTRSRTFKTLRRCDSSGSLGSAGLCSSPVRRLSLDTTLTVFGEEGELYVHIPESSSEEHSPRQRSVAQIKHFVQTANPNAKLPPAAPLTAQRNGPTKASGMLTKKSDGKRQILQDSTPALSLERSAIRIVMTGGGQESTSNHRPGSAVASKLQSQPQDAAPVKSSDKKPVIGRHFSRIQLPSTRASSRTNKHVMTDSLKLYEEQIFTHQILSGQRPLSWCIDTHFLEANLSHHKSGTEEEENQHRHGTNNSSGSPSATNSSSTMSSACSSSSSNASSQHVPQHHPECRQNACKLLL